ncbi:MAG: LLM class F420-dependent oxidoreductase [Acidimicrobiia bacterium]|nr:LLM class F420-dependent oxidoreductase [Acidimicrobiia bacterium]
MDLGLHVASFSWPDSPNTTASTLREIASIADEGGFASLSVMDHFFQLDQWADASEPMLEGYTTLGYLAAVTERIRLGLLVTGVTYRHPGVLAKIISTLDVLSRGRAELGIGAAWYEREHDGLGVPYPPLAERFERLEETLLICLQMWSEDNGTYAGKHYRLTETLNSPQPISQPHPPIMIGGSGEKKTLRLVARYGDACNLFAATPEVASHKLEVLRQHCENEGTEYARIRKTMLYVGSALTQGDHDGFLDEMAGFAAAGIEGVMVMPVGKNPVGFTADLAAEVVPRLQQLATGTP